MRLALFGRLGSGVQAAVLLQLFFAAWLQHDLSSVFSTRPEYKYPKPDWLFTAASGGQSFSVVSSFFFSFRFTCLPSVCFLNHFVRLLSPWLFSR